MRIGLGRQGEGGARRGGKSEAKKLMKAPKEVSCYTRFSQPRVSGSLSVTCLPNVQPATHGPGHRGAIWCARSTATMNRVLLLVPLCWDGLPFRPAPRGSQLETRPPAPPDRGRKVMPPRQPLRFLLADDPGAGKTIMTGLLIKELNGGGQLPFAEDPGQLTRSIPPSRGGLGPPRQEHYGVRVGRRRGIRVAVAELEVREPRRRQQ